MVWDRSMGSRSRPSKGPGGIRCAGRPAPPGREKTSSPEVGSRTNPKPPSCTRWWWKEHSNERLAIEVLPAVGPVHDVVGLHEAGLRAAGEGAALVPDFQRP